MYVMLYNLAPVRLNDLRRFGLLRRGLAILRAATQPSMGFLNALVFCRQGVAGHQEVLPSVPFLWSRDSPLLDATSTEAASPRAEAGLAGSRRAAVGRLTPVLEGGSAGCSTSTTQV